MMTAVQPYLDSILKERAWSWAIVCILYILAAFFVRSWFLGPLSSQMKSLEGKLKKKVTRAYLKRSFFGWFLFFFPLLFILYYWQKDLFPLPIKESWVITISLTSFSLSVFLHLQAFAAGAIDSLKSLASEKSTDI